MVTIREWLKDLGLEEYAELFEEEKVSVQHLPKLTNAHLKELGLPLGPRITVLEAIENRDPDIEPNITGETAVPARNVKTETNRDTKTSTSPTTSAERRISIDWRIVVCDSREPIHPMLFAHPPGQA